MYEKWESQGHSPYAHRHHTPEGVRQLPLIRCITPAASTHYPACMAPSCDQCFGSFLSLYTLPAQL
jgi:hypothetical protein